MKSLLNNIWVKFCNICSKALGIFCSIEIVDNDFINMVIKIGIGLLGLYILNAVIKCLSRSSVDTNQQYEPIRQPISLQNQNVTPKTIDECVSQEDLKFQLDRAEEEVLSAIQRNKQQIADTLKKANHTIDVSWLESCKKIMSVSNTLDNNLAYYAKKNLEMSKFQYYAHLHFRAMIAANIVHHEYEKVDRSYMEINRFIVNMKSNPRFRGSYKSQVHEQKDQIKLIRKYYLERVHHMNMETGVLRDKIGSECGERGKQWWVERTRHKR